MDTSNLGRLSEYTNTPGFVHTWKINDALAQKSGFRKTIVTLKGNSYTGEWYDNKKEGDGHQIWAETGKEYKGTWKNDMRHGTGALWEPINAPSKSKSSRPTTSKKGTSSNLASRSSTRTGTAPSQIGSPKILGIVDPEDNENLRLMYDGGWVWDKMHGNGRRYYRNGDLYDGEWVNGERHGFGTMEYANGDVYEGEWVIGKRQGKGVLFYKKDGNRYEGFWDNDKKDGKGTFYYSAKKQKMDGEWLEDICKCGTMVEYNGNEEWEKNNNNNNGRKLTNSSNDSSPSTSLSSITVPAAPLPAIYLIDSEKILKEQEELVQKLREMRSTNQDNREGEEDEEIYEEGEDDHDEETQNEQ